MFRNDANNAALAAPLRPAPAVARATASTFDEFVQRQYRGLVGFLRGRTGSRQDAEDAAQESFAKLLRYRDSEPVQMWPKLLYRIAINVAHDQHRVAHTHHAGDHIELDGNEIPSGVRSPEERAIRTQQLALLAQAIVALPPKCKRVYLLKRAHDLSHAEIAKICSISVKMVEKHLATALVLLKRKVGDLARETL